MFLINGKSILCFEAHTVLYTYSDISLKSISCSILLICPIPVFNSKAISAHAYWDKVT